MVYPGLGWVVGDGRDICFWTDKWVSNSTLAEAAVCEVPAGLVGTKIRELWTNGRGWDMDLIAPYVSEATKLNLTAHVVDTVTGAKDRPSWRGNADGRFTVKSAYLFLMQDGSHKQSMGAFFKRIWKAVVPERVRVFLWLAVHQVILTNVERH